MATEGGDPGLERLRTVRQMCEEYPNLFTEGRLRWLIFNAEENGFSSCVVRMGRRVFIDTGAVTTWLAQGRTSPDNQPKHHA